MRPYQISDRQYISNDINRYKKAVAEGKEVEAFLGSDLNYRITHRDSLIQDYTDINVLLECCLYPLYVKGDTDIVERTEAILTQFSTSGSVVKLYQVSCFIRRQNSLLTRYEGLPFNIQTKQLVLNIKESLSQLREEEKAYQIEFFTTSVYQVICEMLEKNPAFT